MDALDNVSVPEEGDRYIVKKSGEKYAVYNVADNQVIAYLSEQSALGMRDRLERDYRIRQTIERALTALQTELETRFQLQPDELKELLEDRFSTSEGEN